MPSLDVLTDLLDGATSAVAVEVRSGDLDAAMAALRHAAGTIPAAVREGVETPRISAVAPLPDGALLRLDDLPDDVLSRRRIAAAIADAAEEFLPHGLGDGGALRTVGVDGLADLDTCRRAAVLRIFPPPAEAHGRLSPQWLDLAADWVFGDQPPDGLVRLRILGVEVQVPAKDAAGLLHGCAAARAWCDVVTGSTRQRIRTASISFGIAPHVAVGGGGPSCDDAGLLARFDLLAEVARSCDDSAYACVDFEPTFADLGTGLAGASWGTEGGASPNRVVGGLADRAVPGVFPFQVLGPGHVRALGGTERLAQRPLVAAPLDGGRTAVAVGDVADWLPNSEVRGALVEEGRQHLAPLLLQAGDLEDALRRAATGRAPDPTDDGAVLAAAGLPDLREIVLEPMSHPRRGTRLTALELTAWLAGEPHSDAPLCVSLLLRTYVRELNAGLDDDRRQGLRHVARALIGTAPAGEADENRRAWLLADRLLRTHAPAWLRADGLTESADRLAALPGIDDDTDLVRGVDLLGKAIGIASRRLETTLSIAGADADDADAIAWDAWEDVAQRSGWAAAAEAVAIGLPGSLTFATDQRVMECSRDPEQRSALESSTRGLGDEIWSTALREIASAAWSGAWAAAEKLVHHESTFSVRTTLRRSLQSELGDADDVALDMLIDEVDQAARDTIARLILVGDDESDYWTRGVRAAGRIDDGLAWQRALDSTRDVLGAQLFDEAIEIARGELDSWASRAPQLVSRAVVAAVTREACSVAGRGIAARAAAEVLARTGDEDAAVAAATTALEPLVDALADDAVATVAELASIGRR